MSSQTVVILDDTDPRIHYSPGWHMEGSDNEYNKTTHATSTTGESFTFKFVGTSVKVFGTVPYGTLSNMTYVLDGGDPVYHSGKLVVNQYQQLFFESPALLNTEHSLVGNCVDNTFVWIDFLIVTSPPSPTNQAPPDPHHDVVSATMTASATPGALKPPSATFPTGPVIGCFAGGLVLILVISIMLVHFCRRQASTSPARSMLTPHPYILTQPTTHPIETIEPTSYPIVIESNPSAVVRRASTGLTVPVRKVQRRQSIYPSAAATHLPATQHRRRTMGNDITPPPAYV